MIQLLLIWRNPRKTPQKIKRLKYRKRSNKKWKIKVRNKKFQSNKRMANRNNKPNLQKSLMVLLKIRKTRLNFQPRPPKTRKRKKRRIKIKNWKRRRKSKKMPLLRSQYISLSLQSRKRRSISYHLSRILWLNKSRSRLKLKRLRSWSTKLKTSCKRPSSHQSKKWRFKLRWKQLRRNPQSRIKLGLRSRNKRLWLILSRRSNQKK